MTPQMSENSSLRNLNPVRVVKEELTADDNIIIITGLTGAGKTTFISTAIGRDFGVGHGLEQHTSQITAVRVWRKGDPVVLVDTPGFDNTDSSELDILKRVSDWFRTTSHNPPKLSGILSLHRISDNRIIGPGVTRKNLEMFQKLCGENHLERVILTTTMWAEKESEEYKKAEVQESKLRDDYWERMMKRGSNVRRFEGGQASAWSILDKLIENRKQSIRIRHELSRNWRDAPDTAAGRPLHGILVNIIEKQRDTLRLLVEEVAKATDLEIKEVLIKEWLALREEQKKAARNERRANSTLLSRVLSKLFRPGGKQVTPPFPYRDRCHNLISDILENAEQRDKIACLPGPDAQMMFDFLVTVLRNKRTLATKEQQCIVSLLHCLDKNIKRPGSSASPQEIVAMVRPQMNTSTQGRNDPDGEILILPESLREKQADLKARFSMGRNPSRLRRLICDVFDCLTDLHNCGLVHGNLQATNIVLSDEGRVLVTFSTPSNTTEGVDGDPPCNTTKWKAPELLRGHPLTSASDIWSFGCLCYEVFGTFRHQTNYQAVINKLSNGQRPDIFNETFDKDFSWMRELLERCWSNDPDDRPTCEVIRPIIERIRTGHHPSLDMAEFNTFSLSAKLDSQFEYYGVYRILLSLI